MKLQEIFTANNVAGFMSNALGEQQLLGASLFPARKQLGLDLTLVKGAGGAPVVLRPSAFDTKVTYRDRMVVDINAKKMPFFKEAMLIKEEDRQEFLKLANQPELRQIVEQNIFNDQATLLSGARARLEAMRMQVLATGVVAVNSNGVDMDYDYGVPETNKGQATVAWEEAATADPLADIERAYDALNEAGGVAQALIINNRTLGLIKQAQATKGYFDTDAVVTTRAISEYLDTEFGIQLHVINDVYVDDDKVTKKYYPDGYFTLLPNAVVGETVFGTTPEEMDLQSGGNTNVAVVDLGVAVTTHTTHDPVNIETKVSMIALPSINNLNQVYMMAVGADRI